MPEAARAGLTNTEYERLALAGGVNLSDGHARIPLDAVQRSIIATLPDLFHGLERRSQGDLEAELLEAFFGLCGQRSALDAPGLFLTFSASSALKMIAQVCRRRSLPVLLIEPVFDNIRHFLQYEEVPIIAVEESVLATADRLPRVPGPAALWVVLPNNPTGFCLTEEQFAELAAQCRTRDYTLIVDASFRPHAPSLTQWDMYGVLRSSGADHLVVEDTGKTWSLHDMKVGISVASARYAADLYTLHDQLLLNVSPFHLSVLTAFIRDSQERGLRTTVGAAVERNRRVVHRLVDGGGFEHHGDCRNVPMELLGVPQGTDAHRFWEVCRRGGVEVLPAQNYYWNSAKGDRLFRVPLARPTGDVTAACEVLRRMCEPAMAKTP
ncbi:pyridoxal phosphate-dependent aminotransferase [Actinomadura viridis]|uniref:Aspartate/methionine/tyrosine aminotransferase n=1 Tax=Actinomadura viridis TaxID=58110 RepID=A0A931DM46_9ACTN|nr:pyridoxal phosphate-dependent aminotransferase [Actinomadura viridis]MBG6089153.1 aspartate/methionine/tyrosine aminotransferase [Actinomadura viridis]